MCMNGYLQRERRYKYVNIIICIICAYNKEYVHKKTITIIVCRLSI